MKGVDGRSQEVSAEQGPGGGMHEGRTYPSPGLRGVDFGAMPMVTQSTDRYVYYRP
jgi:hypothetical protein